MSTTRFGLSATPSRPINVAFATKFSHRITQLGLSGLPQTMYGTFTVKPAGGINSKRRRLIMLGSQ